MSLDSDGGCFMTEVSENKKKEIRQRLFGAVKAFSDDNELLKPYFEKLKSATTLNRFGQSNGEEYFYGNNGTELVLKNELDGILNDCISFLSDTDRLNNNALDLGQGIKDYLHYNYVSIAHNFPAENVSEEKSNLIHRHSLAQKGFRKQYRNYAKERNDLKSRIDKAGFFEKKKLRVDLKEIDDGIANLKKMADIALENFENKFQNIGKTKQQSNDRSQ